MPHIPVLLNETLEYLNAESGSNFVDATLGSGGHAKAILEANPKAEVLGIDLDKSQLAAIQFERLEKVWGNYREIDKFLQERKITPDGILLDLGFSSSQLDDPSRGFSFQSDGPLDMRYDSASDITAEKVVNRYPEKKLERIFSDLGEEKFAKKIARSIVLERKGKDIVSTQQLAEAVKKGIPAPLRYKSADSIRRIFQAIRIEVNGELENLKIFLPKAVEALKPGGRLVVISFHSLEDRIVKEFFNREAKGCVCPPDFPTCVCGKASRLRVLTRKPIEATEEEVAANPRSKPAKLRAAEKIS